MTACQMGSMCFASKVGRHGRQLHSSLNLHNLLELSKLALVVLDVVLQRSNKTVWRKSIEMQRIQAAFPGMRRALYERLDVYVGGEWRQIQDFDTT